MELTLDKLSSKPEIATPQGAEIIGPGARIWSIFVCTVTALSNQANSRKRLNI
jgi:hypothetical protein